MNKFNEKMIKFYNFLLDIIYPPDIKCIFCGDDIENFKDKPYCKNCEKELNLNNSNTCEKCAGELLGEEKICDFCQHKKRHFKKLVAPLKYDNIVRNTIIKFKDKKAKYLARGFSVLMNKSLIENKIEFDYIIPVPISKKSLFKRKYNQSKLLAIQLGKITNKEVLDILDYSKDIKKQKTLNYKERLENMKDAFVVKKEYIKIIKNKNILIVDDIITTCSTVDNCAKALKKYPKNIYICGISRNSIKK